MPTGATGMLCLHLHCWNKRHYFSFVLHFNTHTLVFTFVDSFVAEMVNSQPAYIIKCTSATRHRHRLAVLMFFQCHHPSHLFIAISPGTFLSKIMLFLYLIFLLLQGRKKKAQSKSWSPYTYEWQNNMDALSSACITSWMLRLYHQINSLSLQDHSHRLLTEAAIGSDKTKRKYPNWPEK